MPDFELRITTPTELEGARQLEASLERDLGKAKALGASLEDIAQKETKLAQVRESIKAAQNSGPQGVDKEIADTLAGAGVGGFGKIAEEAKEATHHVGLFGKATHEVKAALHLLGEEVPGLARLGHFLFTPLTAIIGAGIFAIEKMREGLAELKSTMEELEGSPGARGEWAEHQREAMVEASVEAAKFRQSIQDIILAEKTLKETTDLAVAQRKMELQGFAEIAAAQREMEEAKIEARLKAGEITNATAIKLKVEIDEKYFKEQLDLKLKMIEVEMAARQKQLSGADGENKAAISARQKAEAEAKTASDAKIKNDDQRKLAEDNLAKEKSAREANDKAIKDLDEKNTGPVAFVERGLGLKYAESVAYNNRLKERAENDKNISDQQRAVDMAKAKEEELNKAAALASEKLAEAKKREEQTVKDAKEAEETSRKLQQQLEVERAKNAALQEIHNKTVETKATGEIAARKTELEKKASAGGLTPMEANELKDLGKTKPFPSQMPGPASTNRPVKANAGVPDPEQIEVNRVMAQAADFMRRAQGGQTNLQGPILDLLKHLMTLLGPQFHETAEHRRQLEEIKRQMETLKSSQSVGRNT